MTLFLPATIPARDRNGTVLGNAVWNFYRKQTLTPADVVGAVDSVTADSAGDFAPITLETDVTYRAVLKDADGKVLFDIGALLDNYFSPAVKQAMDENSRVLSGATWSFYTAGTTTRQPVYADEALATKLGYVITANGAGVFPNVYLDDAVSYKAVLADSAGTTLATLDPVNANTMASYLDPSALLTLEPSADWNGTAGTGFGAPYGEVPTDPTRTTAKPACRLLVPERQAFTDTLLVGVYAGANNAGSLMETMGLEKVIFHYEGSTTEVLSPSFQTFDDANGVPVTYFGWWVSLLKPAATAGKAQLYVEAVPADGTMQSRVLGPYTYLPVATLYDYDVTVASSGADYTTISSALNGLRASAAKRPRITVTEAGTYTIYPGGTGTIPYTGADARCVIEASVPITLGLTLGTANSFRPRWAGLELRGSNLTLDTRYVSDFWFNETGWNAVFSGVNFIHSGGRGETWFGGERAVSWISRSAPYYMECTFDNTVDTCLGNANLIRGCTLTQVAGDAFTDALCVIGNTVNDQDSIDWNTEINALTVAYGGAGATATLSLSGGNYASGRTMTAKVDGASVGTTTINTSTLVSAVATWLNTLTGFTATTLDDTRSASTLTVAGTQGAGFTDISVKPTATFPTRFDFHVDWYQNNGAIENVVIADNVATNCTLAQLIFFTNDAVDWLVVNNSWMLTAVAGGFSQLWDLHKHVVIAHNNLPNQTLQMRPAASRAYNPDAYCLTANNVFYALAWDGTADANLVIANNHLTSAGSAPTYATGTTISGDAASLFTDAAAGDFTPAGDLLTNLKTPVVKYDAAGELRGTTAPAGALA